MQIMERGCSTNIGTGMHELVSIFPDQDKDLVDANGVLPFTLDSGTHISRGWRDRMSRWPK